MENISYTYSESELVLLAVNAAVKAGEAIMQVYKKDFSVEYKEDKSPLTEADMSAHQVIKSYLEDRFPILSEEGRNIPFDERMNWDVFWLVDPLDGTKEFIKKNDEFTVNIALIRNNKPVIGVVYGPAIATLYFGSEEAGSYKCTIEPGSWYSNLSDLTAISERLHKSFDMPGYTIVASRSHLNSETKEFIEKAEAEHREVKLVSKGSSIKLCLVAEGNANVYPRLAPTMEWDTAAAHAVAKFAGCQVIDYNTREELRYNKEDLLNPYFLVSR
ncbi:MAG: 3'(2'),5'-bisphosphate nucleotidase CysQ [Chitinophagaceae bacterium]|nr:3'(2'),5'-bisphosphate nucleotidase CysQ [Chitinophagaceae bacterium]